MNSKFPSNGLGIGIIGLSFINLFKYLYNSIYIYNYNIYQYTTQNHHFIKEELFNYENYDDDDDDGDYEDVELFLIQNLAYICI